MPKSKELDNFLQEFFNSTEWVYFDSPSDPKMTVHENAERLIKQISHRSYEMGYQDCDSFRMYEINSLNDLILHFWDDYKKI